MFCGLGEEERKKFRKKKGKKNEEKKKKLHRGQKWVGWMEAYLKTYNHMKYFLPYLKPFLTETAFYAKLAGRFSGSKTKITWSIVSKFGTNL